MSNSNLAYESNNVVGLHNSNLYSYIQLFLNDKADNTKRSYSSYIDNFFMYMLGKHTNAVSWEDLTNKTIFNIANMDKYYSYLQKEVKDSKGNKLCAKTVNGYMAAVKSLFKTLGGYGEELGYYISSNIFINCSRLKAKDVHWGEMSNEEIWNLIKYAKTENYEGLAKSVYFEALFAFGTRKTATLELTYSMIKQDYDRKNDIRYWKVELFDKGKDVSFPIPDELYYKLLSIKKENNDRIFNFSEKEARATFSRYCEVYSIDKDARTLSLHSLKHSGVIKTLEENNYDYELTKEYSHHSKTSTLFEYTNKRTNLETNPIYNFYKESTIENVLALSHEDLIEIIKNAPAYIQKELDRLAKEKIKK